MTDALKSLQDEIKFYDNALEQISRLFGIDTPLQLVEMSENDNESYCDILIKHIERTLTKLQEKPMQTTDSKPAYDDFLRKPIDREGLKHYFSTLGNEHMETTDIKPGDTVRVIPGAKEKFISEFGASEWKPEKNKMIGNLYTVDYLGEVYGKKVAMLSADKNCYAFPFDALEKVTQEAEAQEIKLEQGIEYYIPILDETYPLDSGCSICEFIIFYKDNYIFKNPLGIVNLKESEIKGIKKHSEPFKHKLIKYVVYTNEPPTALRAVDGIIKKSSDHNIYSTYENARYEASQWSPSFGKVAKIELDATVHYDVEE